MEEVISQEYGGLIMDITAEREITVRFFEAFNYLLELKKIDNIYRFCLDYKIDRRNFLRVEKDPNRFCKLTWLAILVSDFGIDGNWVLTGKGSKTVK